MGAWGVGPFDNDDAADWAAEFDGAGLDAGLAVIRGALAEAADAGDYVESDAGARAVAAVVAWCAGAEVDETPSSAAAVEWVRRTQPSLDAGLVELARRVLRRVLAPGSELADLWGEAGPAWQAAVEGRAASLSCPESYVRWRFRRALGAARKAAGRRTPPANSRPRTPRAVFRAVEKPR